MREILVSEILVSNEKRIALKSKYAEAIIKIVKGIEGRVWCNSNKNWFFEGQDGGQYSKRCIQNIFKDALEKSGIKKWASVHTLSILLQLIFLNQVTTLEQYRNY